MWVAAVALLALGLGLRSAWRVMKDLRQPASVEDALLCWDDEPVSAFRQDPFVASLLAVHASAIVLMGIVALLAGSSAPASPPEWLAASAEPWSTSGSTWIVYFAAVALSAGLAWYVIGATVARPLASRRFSPIRMALTEDGIHHGSLFFPWSSFGPMRQECQRGLIHLMSRKSPGLVLATLCPPGGDLFARAQQVIEAHLLPPPGGDRLPWYRRRAAFGLCLLLTALPTAIVGLWAYPSTALWVVASQGLGAWLAAWLGGRVIQAYH
jgi:hypothetical protein